MCVGHPKRHPCQHTSVTYNHCVAAHFDGATRVTTPCHNTTYAAPIDTESKCTNQLCFFEELGGSWICCKCGNGPNYVGWCTYDNPRTEVNAITQQVEQVTKCDHCCCWNCTPYSTSGQGGSSHGGSSKRGGSSKHKHHKSSKHGGSSSQGYQWIEMDYSSKGGSSGHKKRKHKEK
ncbi:hypothetical protein INS49_015071 [Diaporthe citri]|uniref:uncharacterized protein n=1 Tax=Diaporthe citri TaxID=83186 RepID=UPI001C82537A|nr:uncharacterized protein INS49_015071 [Diaporthe citri]KAG6357193.1 hypothetical protein INS49_015071 [Diaporthe citri]